MTGTLTTVSAGGTIYVLPGHSFTYALTVAEAASFIGTVRVESSANGATWDADVSHIGTVAVPLTLAVGSGTIINEHPEPRRYRVSVVEIGLGSDGISWVLTPAGLAPGQVPAAVPGVVQGKITTARVTLAGTLVLTNDSARYQFLDPNGSGRTVTLPANEKDLAFVFHHTGNANTITVKDAAAVSVVALSAGESAVVVYDGTEWQVL